MKRLREQPYSPIQLFDSPFKTEATQLDYACWVLRTTLKNGGGDGNDFDAMWVMKPENRATIMIMGKPTEIPRFQQTYGERAYKFSGVEHQALAIPPLLQRYLDVANTLCKSMLEADYGGRKFNMVFANWYPDQTSYIGWHADDEKQLFHNDRGETLVLSMSFGATRRFLMRSKDEGEKKFEFELSNGSVFLMAGLCQRHFKHSVPKTAKKTGARINLTFRIFR